MTKFLAYLTQCLAHRNGLCRLSLPRAKAFLGLCNPRFVYGCERFVLHLHKQALGQPFVGESTASVENSQGLTSRCNGRTTSHPAVDRRTEKTPRYIFLLLTIHL